MEIYRIGNEIIEGYMIGNVTIMPTHEVQSLMTSYYSCEGVQSGAVDPGVTGSSEHQAVK